MSTQLLWLCHKKQANPFFETAHEVNFFHNNFTSTDWWCNFSLIKLESSIMPIFIYQQIDLKLPY